MYLTPGQRTPDTYVTCLTCAVRVHTVPSVQNETVAIRLQEKEYATEMALCMLF